MRSRRHGSTAGFTLIEMMIVVAIIGILAAVAIPLYVNYSKQSKLSEVAAGFDGMRTALNTFNAKFGQFPAAMEVAGPAAPDNNKHGWTAANATCTSAGEAVCESAAGGAGCLFSCLGYQPEGPTFCNYTEAASGTGYALIANCDVDHDGATATRVYVNNGLAATLALAPAACGLTAAQAGQVVDCTPGVF